MYYVYCIESEAAANRRYIGFTEDLRQRVIDHNRGCNPSTSPLKPWKLRGYLAFDEKAHALDFERSVDHRWPPQRWWRDCFAAR